MYAIIRYLEIIGEAVKHMPEEVKRKYPKIPWKEMAGMRDKLIHGYFGVDIDLVWNTVVDDVPKLKDQLQEMRQHEQELNS